jgi:hypothetical protein
VPLQRAFLSLRVGFGVLLLFGQSSFYVSSEQMSIYPIRIDDTSLFFLYWGGQFFRGVHLALSRRVQYSGGTDVPVAGKISLYGDLRSIRLCFSRGYFLVTLPALRRTVDGWRLFFLVSISPLVFSLIWSFSIRGGCLFSAVWMLLPSPRRFVFAAAATVGFACCVADAFACCRYIPACCRCARLPCWPINDNFILAVAPAFACH